MTRLAPRRAATASVLWIALALAAPATRAQNAASSRYTETVTVTDTRLDDQPQPSRDVPASVTVITRERIAASGARTLQELLALEAGIIMFDQVGNAYQTTLDLRGFSGGGTAVFVDGARINDPRNNGVSLETIPLDAIERVEITRGAASATVGGGSQAGVVRVVTRAGAPGGSVRAGFGTWGTGQYGVTLGWNGSRKPAPGGSAGAAADEGPDVFLSATRDETDGFRTNSDVTLDRYSLSTGWGFGQAGRLSLSVTGSSGELGAPGALTKQELDKTVDQSPYNSLDFSDQSQWLASLNWRGPLGNGVTLAANLFARGDDVESLTTGRSATSFGGSFLNSGTDAAGGVVQTTWEKEAGKARHALTGGIEYQDGSVDALGVRTPATDLDDVDRGNAYSKNTTDRRTQAWFLQEALTWASGFTLTAGLREDDDAVEYRETIPDPTLDKDRSFSETSLRVGAAWNPSEKVGFYASWGESFLPPTAEQLFAFPGFGSNPKLDPETADSYEMGARGSWLVAGRDGTWSAALFRTDTRDEIIFDPTPVLPSDPFGRNVNGGETRRDGFEIGLAGRLSQPLRAYLNLTWTDAEFQNGPDEGNRVPLVPKERLSAGIDWSLPNGFSLGADSLYVGGQVLDNDTANAQERLDSYFVVNVRARMLILGPTLKHNPGETPRGVSVFAEMRNAFDEEYSSRGIYAFDFSTLTNEVFLTPAPGRRILGGLEWNF